MRLEFSSEICYRVARCMTEERVKIILETFLDNYFFTVFCTHSESMLTRGIYSISKAFSRKMSPIKIEVVGKKNQAGRVFFARLTNVGLR